MRFNSAISALIVLISFVSRATFFCSSSVLPLKHGLTGDVMSSELFVAFLVHKLVLPTLIPDVTKTDNNASVRPVSSKKIEKMLKEEFGINSTNLTPEFNQCEYKDTE